MIKTIRTAFQILFFAYSALLFFNLLKLKWAVMFYNSFHIFPCISSMSSNAAPCFRFFAVVLVVSALFAGRFYCSFLCPLGFIQDILFRVSNALKIKKETAKQYPYLRVFIMFTCIFSAAFSVSTLWGGFDHFTNFGKMFAGVISPLIYFILRPFSSYLDAGGYIQIEYFEAAPNFDLIYALSFTILIIASAMFRPRWFCSVICPSGAVFALLFKNSFINIKKDSSCTSCGKCEKECPALCINKGDINKELCVSCFECLDACPSRSLKVEHSYPFEALENASADIKQQPVTEIENMGRRVMIKRFSAAIAGIFVSSALKKVGPVNSGFKTRTVLPPGAVTADNFFSKCSACHLCVSVCPTGVLKPAGLENGLAGLSKPMLDFSKSYCANDCTACTETCPTGALRYQKLESKKNLVIGLVVLNSGPGTECVAYKNKQDCSACAEACPTGAIYMKLENGLRVPRTWRKFCIGCGICENLCPVTGDKKPVRVFPIQKQIIMRPMNEEDKKRAREDAGYENYDKIKKPPSSKKETTDYIESLGVKFEK